MSRYALIATLLAVLTGCDHQDAAVTGAIVAERDRMVAAQGTAKTAKPLGADVNLSSEGLKPNAPASATTIPLHRLCVGMQDGHHLRAIVVQENDRHFRYHGCDYGRLARIERDWITEEGGI